MCSKSLGLKIEKLIDYLDKIDPLRIPYLETSREKNYFKYDKMSDEIVCQGWSEDYHYGDSYNEIEERHPIVEVGEKVYKTLMDKALSQAEREYDREQEEKKRVEKIKAVKTYLNTKVFGQSIDFILED